MSEHPLARNETVALPGCHGEKDVLFTTVGRKSIGFSFQVCNVRFPIVSVYPLTQAGCRLEVNDTTAQLKLPGSGALDWN